MKFSELPISGMILIEPELKEDARGFFARVWCEEECKKQGLHTDFIQSSITFNKSKNTLRGMHFQKPPFEEIKLIRCTKGGIYDVTVDLREKSKTFQKWFAVELSETNHKMLYVPRGIAHGYLTLTDNSEIFYNMSEKYAQDSASGVRWNDPVFQIDWPQKENLLISEKDLNWPEWSFS